MDYVRLARGLPPHVVLKKACSVLQAGIVAWTFRLRDRFWSTFPDGASVPTGPLTLWLKDGDVGALAEHVELLLACAQQSCEHRFDLLGSGSIVVRHGLAAQGVEGHVYHNTKLASPDPQLNRANRKTGESIRGLISAGYIPIDWQADFKSGFRWSELTWYRHIEYAELPGVDVKVPWELSRCQHMPQMALAFGILQRESNPSAQDVWREFQNQVLDFTANNPPRYGVNWCCTMDVAIRAANWTLAFQLFRAQGAVCTEEFEWEFRRSLAAHGRHIVDNFEWFATLRSNHYLSNVCGLLFVAATLPQSDETDAWLSIAAPETIRETLLQMQPDGSNFEASTSYHRLSTEMVVFSLALLRAIPRERMDRVLKAGPSKLAFNGPGPDPKIFALRIAGADAIPWDALCARMERVRDFTVALERPDGGVLQFGDNDSGRFFCMLPHFFLNPQGVPTPAPASYCYLVSAMDALLGVASSDKGPDAQIVAALVQSSGQMKRPEKDASNALRSVGFKDFGLYVFSLDRIWCAIRCGSVGQRGNGGHAHNDQLSIELCVDGVAFVVDPGTYLYTPRPERRNAMRSTAAHNTILAATGAEQNGWVGGRLGLFSMNRTCSAQVVDSKDAQWTGLHNGFGKECIRTLFDQGNCLEFVDSFDGAFSLHFQLAPGCEVCFESPRSLILSRLGCRVRFVFDDGNCSIQDGAYSPSYGTLVLAPAIRVDGLIQRVRWVVLPFGAGAATV